MSAPAGKFSHSTEAPKEEVQFDPNMRRQNWLKRRADELDIIERLVPIKMLPDWIEYARSCSTSVNVERYDALMATPRQLDTTADVPTQVFQKFLETIVTAGGNTEMVGRLKTTLLEKPDLSEEALETAIFGESSDDD